MAYNKYTWKSGDVISSARLNNIEDGIEEAMSSGGGVMIVNVTENEDSSGAESPTYKADKTYEEIKAALDDGQMVVACILMKFFLGTTYKIYFYYESEFLSGDPLTPIIFSNIDASSRKIIVINSQNEVSYNESVLRSCFQMGTNATYTEKDGESQTTYSSTGRSYSTVIDNIRNGVNVILNVNYSDKIMIYTVSEYYPNDQVIAFNGAGKVGPLYMDKDGNISEKYPTSV